METPERRGRSPSAGHMSNHGIRHSASPSPHGLPHPPQPDYLLSTGHQTFTPADFAPDGLDSDLAFDMVGQINGTSQPHTFRNDFTAAALTDAAFDNNGMNVDNQPSGLKMDPPRHPFNPHLLDSHVVGSFGDGPPPQFSAKEGLSFDNPFNIDPTSQQNMQNHQSINPADLMNSASSPQNMIPTPPNLMPPGHRSPPPNPPSTTRQHL